VTRISVDVNDEWLDAAREVLGTDTKAATINEALRLLALRKQAAEIMAAFDSAEMDFEGSAQAWRYGGGGICLGSSRKPERIIWPDGRRYLSR
jgi:Arc/MetJ family transcription regulator